ncbi:MAG TPA: orotate phosphoribosyltransferase [Bacteroidales bacterium]|nr:orotate phosphoribosyltransferase [Bacteroidales bacterium]HRC90348.1 orotate phosphoribosyltransferase [Bacteroidales bacterium]
MKNISKKIAGYLLQINAIKLQPTNPFTWASGIKSPIYCDNRRILSFPEVRSFVCYSFTDAVKIYYPDVEVIAGVATGAIAHGVLVAEKLNLPFIYVRSDAKDHGLCNRVEGYFEKGQKVVVIEDLISTGGTSLSAVKALRDEGCYVLGMIAIFTYGFQKTYNKFLEENCELHTLCDYDTLIETALEKGFISNAEVEGLKKWRSEISDF